jgi:predicted aspartyl protease
LTLTRRELASGASAAFGSAALPTLARAQTPQPSVRFAGAAVDTGWIAFADSSDSIVLTVLVNGHPVQAVLDNGASQTALDFRLVNALGLGHGGGVEVDGISGGAGAALLQPIVVQVGPLTIALPTPIVLDVQRSGIAQSMLLGREIFEHLIVDLDLPNQRLAFRLPGAFMPPSEMIAAPLEPQASGARLTAIGLENQPRVLAMFDLGSEEALAISAAYAHENNLGAGRRTAQWVSGGVEGIEPITVTTLDDVRFGQARLRDVPVSLVGHWSRIESAVNIGMPILSRYRLITDFGRDRLWLRADAKDLREPFARNRSGLACLPKDGTLTVIFVAPGSPGAAAGFHAGDRIAAVDGAVAAPGLRAWGGGPAGKTVTLTLADGSRRTLTLADYF